MRVVDVAVDAGSQATSPYWATPPRAQRSRLEPRSLTAALDDGVVDISPWQPARPLLEADLLASMWAGPERRGFASPSPGAAREPAVEESPILSQVPPAQRALDSPPPSALDATDGAVSPSSSLLPRVPLAQRAPSPLPSVTGARDGAAFRSASPRRSVHTSPLGPQSTSTLSEQECLDGGDADCEIEAERWRAAWVVEKCRADNAQAQLFRLYGAHLALLSQVAAAMPAEVLEHLPEDAQRKHAAILVSDCAFVGGTSGDASACRSQAVLSSACSRRSGGDAMLAPAASTEQSGSWSGRLGGGAGGRSQHHLAGRCPQEGCGQWMLTTLTRNDLQAPSRLMRRPTCRACKKPIWPPLMRCGVCSEPLKSCECDVWPAEEP